MLERLTHRGPDDADSKQVGRTWLGHRRLSIVDVDGGRQPLANEDETLFLVANGEIYNHLDIRESLTAHRFRTRSDSEVALHLIEEQGPRAIAQLRGMFALVVAAADGRLVVARDPVGIKPLYWARRGETILFASELKAFDPDWLPLAEAFPPGHYWTPEEGLVAFTALPAPAAPAEIAPEGEALERGLKAIRESLIRAVERRMMADVEVGVFLSGGLDSSLVASIASRWAKRNGKRLKSFAVGQEGSPDLLAARKVAEYLGTDHHEQIYTTQEAVEAVPEVVRMIESFDPSLVESAVANYFVARLAARHVKVVLTGEGADELFAGYKYFAGYHSTPELHGELIRTIRELHHLNLQRCDRTTMAHGLEARVPFLDLEMIETGLSIPVGWKQIGPAGMEKWILRQAFAEGYLPDEILWRTKVQFNEGTGTTDTLRKALGKTVSEEAFQEGRNCLTPPLATPTEMAYYRLFRRDYAPVIVDRVIGRSPAVFATQ